MAVGVGILASRVLGLVRQKVFAFYLGAGGEADAFNLAFRIPNLLQNLFGEGALSASFIPQYSRLRARGDDAARQSLAGAILGLLSLAMALLALVGVALAPWLVDVIASGVEGETRALTVSLVRILFPGAALLVISAWCLGVLNSHGRFLLSYASPVLWNAAMIGALLAYGPREEAPQLVTALAWASVLGSVLQVVVQLPAVHAALGVWRLSLGRGQAPVRAVLGNFGPALIGRGVTQVSAWVDTGIASHLVQGSATMLANAQVLSMLPVSLFGISVSAAQLPAMSGEGDDAMAKARVRERLLESLGQVAFWVIPCVVGFITAGDAIVMLLFRGGAFGTVEAQWLHGTIAAAAVGLLAATMGRLYSTTLYALEDTRTPQRRAMLRVALGAGLALAGARWGPSLAGIDARWSVAFLSLGSGVAAWVECALLRRDVSRRVGPVALDLRLGMRMWGAAVASGLVTWIVARQLRGASSVAVALATLVLFGVLYGGVSVALRVPQAVRVMRRLLGAR